MQINNYSKQYSKNFFQIKIFKREALANRRTYLLQTLLKAISFCIARQQTTSTGLVDLHIFVHRVS